MLTSVDPVTGSEIARYEPIAPAQLDRALGEARETALAWRTYPLAERSGLLGLAAARLRERAAELAALMAAEMGKPVAQGRAEVEKCAWVCEYYAEHAAAFLAPQRIETEARRSGVVFRPLGVVLAVMPWNFPLWQVFRFAAPALVAGNTGLLKHASNVSGCALQIEAVFRDAGFPAGCFTTLLLPSRAVEAVIADPRVAAVTLTGSTPAGRAVAAAAGAHLKKSVLELGGSDPYVVLADADVEHAAAVCAASRLVNSGQSCIAAKRFVVVPEVREAFEQAFVARMAEAPMGDPTAERTEVGPQARRDLRDELHRQVARSVRAGARVLLGGEVPEGPGAFYPPSVLTDVAPGQPAYDEELFGPVGAVIPAADEEDAIRIANDSPFGLGAAVFTQDEARGAHIAADRLDAGCCFVNDFVRSDPRLPFGGVKESGYGRELSAYGIREFVNVKTVVVA